MYLRASCAQGPLASHLRRVVVQEDSGPARAGRYRTRGRFDRDEATLTERLGIPGWNPDYGGSIPPRRARLPLREAAQEPEEPDDVFNPLTQPKKSVSLCPRLRGPNPRPNKRSTRASRPPGPGSSRPTASTPPGAPDDARRGVPDQPFAPAPPAAGACSRGFRRSTASTSSPGSSTGLSRPTQTQLGHGWGGSRPPRGLRALEGDPTPGKTRRRGSTRPGGDSGDPHAQDVVPRARMISPLLRLRRHPRRHGGFRRGRPSLPGAQDGRRVEATILEIQDGAESRRRGSLERFRDVLHVRLCRDGLISDDVKSRLAALDAEGGPPGGEPPPGVMSQASPDVPTRHWLADHEVQVDEEPRLRGERRRRAQPELERRSRALHPRRVHGPGPRRRPGRRRGVGDGGLRAGGRAREHPRTTSGRLAWTWVSRSTAAGGGSMRTPSPRRSWPTWPGTSNRPSP